MKLDWLSFEFPEPRFRVSGVNGDDSIPVDWRIFMEFSFMGANGVMSDRPIGIMVSICPRPIAEGSLANPTTCQSMRTHV